MYNTSNNNKKKKNRHKPLICNIYINHFYGNCIQCLIIHKEIVAEDSFHTNCLATLKNYIVENIRYNTIVRYTIYIFHRAPYHLTALFCVLFFIVCILIKLKEIKNKTHFFLFKKRDLKKN